MRSTIYLALIFFLVIISQKCANPGNPTGGPKDTIPPEFITSTPEFGKINFDQSEISLAFDERVMDNRLKQNLLVTPTYEGDYSAIVKKNIFTIKFEEPFADSTTYTLNFFEGITDVTEKNPAENLVYVFSTGTFLDSLKISGKVRDLLNQKPVQDITIALFGYTDTLDVSEDKPLYFTKTDEEGEFLINYIKDGVYKLFAFGDENRNLLLDTESENYGFLPDSLVLKNSLDSLVIDLVSIDASELKLISARPFSNYFDIRYSKPINSYRIKPFTEKDTIKVDSLGHSLSNENKSVRFYHNIYLPPEDSLGIIIKAEDTLSQILIDTVYIRFNETIPKKEEYIVTNISTKPQVYSRDINLRFRFNKPTYPQLREDSIFYRFDTVYQVQPDTISYRWNYSNTNLSMEMPIDWSKIQDSILAQLDTTQIDSTQRAKFNLTQLSLYYGESTFISVENDSSGTSLKIKKYDPEEYGLLKVILDTEEDAFILELIDEKFETIRSIRNKKEYTFTKLPLGSYSFRVLLDKDGDGKWSSGNVLKDQPPEPVIIYDKFTDLRPNFEITIEDFSF